MLVPQQVSMILSSNPASGAINRSDDGSYFEVQLSDPLAIPSEALNVSLSVEEASVWWVVPNVITAENNLMYITGFNSSDVLTNFVLQIPTGLYDLSGLNSAILRELENADAKISPNPLLTLTPDEPTQKVEIRFDYDNVSIDFTQANTFRDILGFNSQILGTYASAPINVLADNIANFNSINFFLLHSDLTSSGIRFNDTYNQTVSQILIDVAAGSQIVNKPFNAAQIAAQELAGAKRTNVRMWLTDDQNRPVNTNGEYFTARIVIHYYKPYVIA